MRSCETSSVRETGCALGRDRQRHTSWYFLLWTEKFRYIKRLCKLHKKCEIFLWGWFRDKSSEASAENTINTYPISSFVWLLSIGVNSRYLKNHFLSAGNKFMETFILSTYVKRKNFRSFLLIWRHSLLLSLLSLIFTAILCKCRRKGDHTQDLWY